MQVSKTRSTIPARGFKPLAMDSKAITVAAVNQLAQKFGIVFDHATVLDQVRLLHEAPKGVQIGMDSFATPATAASLPTPVQFLQQWLPGFIKVMTAARKIDDIVGVKNVGSWEDREIVQGIVEPAAVATEYGDMTNIPLTNYNPNFIKRTIVRGELGIQVGLLEEGTSAAMRLSASETKRQAAAVGLEMFRNAIGFYGWNAGNNQTYGFLNDPNLPAYIASSVTGGWAGTNGNFQSITGDIRMAIVQLRTQSQDQIDPKKVKLRLILPMNIVDLLSITTDFGVSVADWLEQTYPNIEVVSAPELQGANGGANVFYLFAEDIDSSVDGSTDGGEVFVQLVQTKFVTLGVEKRAKSYVEDYSNGTAGVLCKRPWAIVRVTGI
jgi:hypothetical protein